MDSGDPRIEIRKTPRELGLGRLAAARERV
jgi:hypothetical protein